MTEKQKGAPALDDVATKREADRRAPADSPKPHGDKLGVAGSTASQAAASAPVSADSPKPHGDELRHAVDEAARKR